MKPLAEIIFMSNPSHQQTLVSMKLFAREVYPTNWEREMTYEFADGSKLVHVLRTDIIELH